MDHQNTSPGMNLHVTMQNESKTELPIPKNGALTVPWNSLEHSKRFVPNAGSLSSWTPATELLPTTPPLEEPRTLNTVKDEPLISGLFLEVQETYRHLDSLLFESVAKAYCAGLAHTTDSSTLTREAARTRHGAEAELPTELL